MVRFLSKKNSESLSRLLKTMTVLFFVLVFEKNTTKCCMFYAICVPLQRKRKFMVCFVIPFVMRFMACGVCSFYGLCNIIGL